MFIFANYSTLRNERRNMRLSRFKKYIKTWDFQRVNGRLLFPLEKLGVYHPENNRLIQLASDPRTTRKAVNCGNGCVEEMQNVKPIAEGWSCVWIVCPYCGEIHSHTRHPGVRLSHCKDRVRDNYYIDFSS